MWSLWLNIEKDLKENTPFNPVFEVLQSKEAKKLLRPVPQLVLPMPASGSPHVQASLDDIFTKSTPAVEPVDFEHVDAIVESSRAASAHVTRGKILSCRNPNLMIHYNKVTVSRSWEQVRGAGK